MSRLLFLFFLISGNAFGQWNIDSAKRALKIYKLGSYSYHESFIGKSDFAAPLILTRDGGAAKFGDDETETGKGGTLVKVDKHGKEQWKYFIKPQFSEIESQSIIEDQKGNIYAFVLSYDYKRYRGGTQRVLKFDSKGKMLWDKTYGLYSVMKSPTFASISMQPSGQLYIRGQMVTDVPASGKDPLYRYWEGWINGEGTLTQKTGEVIDWKAGKWKKWMDQQE